jgi:hypothetical protein
MDQLIIDYGTHLVTQSRSIHDFVILLGQIRILESIFRPKKKVLITGKNIGLLP